MLNSTNCIKSRCTKIWVLYRCWYSSLHNKKIIICYYKIHREVRKLIKLVFGYLLLLLSKIVVWLGRERCLTIRLIICSLIVAKQGSGWSRRGFIRLLVLFMEGVIAKNSQFWCVTQKLWPNLREEMLKIS